METEKKKSVLREIPEAAEGGEASADMGELFAMVTSGDGDLMDSLGALDELVNHSPKSVADLFARSPGLFESLVARATTVELAAEVVYVARSMCGCECLIGFLLCQPFVALLAQTLQSTRDVEVVNDIAGTVSALVETGREAANAISRERFLEACFAVLEDQACENYIEISLVIGDLFSDFCSLEGFCPYCMDKMMEMFSNLVRSESVDSVSTGMNGFIKCSRYHDNEFVRYIEKNDTELCNHLVSMMNSEAFVETGVVELFINLTSLVSYEYRLRLVRNGIIEVLSGLLEQYKEKIFAHVVDIVHNLIVNDADEYAGDDDDFLYDITEAVFPFVQRLFSLANDDMTLSDKTSLAHLFAAVVQCSDRSIKMAIAEQLGFVKTMVSYCFVSKSLGLMVVSSLNILFDFFDQQMANKEDLRACILAEASLDDIHSCLDCDDPAFDEAYVRFEQHMNDQ